jgi:tetratricopeptide (TPR) repeat protein
LLEAGRSADAQGKLETRASMEPDPWLSFASARLAYLRGNLESARWSASQTIEQIESGQDQPGFPFSTAENLSKFVGLLLEINQAGEACQVMDRALSQAPGVAAYLALAAHARLAAREYENAAQAAHQACALQPESNQYRRLLADCLGKTGDWQSAYQERRAIAAQDDEINCFERYTLAATALLAGATADALPTAELLVEEDPTDGLSWALAGESNARLGNTTVALEQLVKAANLAPEHAAPWLSLARLYKLMGDEQKAIGTLQSAILAAPGFPEIQLALGECYLEKGLMTQAQTVLQQAANLIEVAQYQEADIPWYHADLLSGPTGAPDKNDQPVWLRQLPDQVALRLGQTMFQLGHISNACQILGAAYQRSPADTEIAWQYAQALLALNDRAAALPPLKAVIDSGHQEIEPYIHYARLILDGETPQAERIPASTAIPYLRHVLASVPYHPQATAYLADALAATQELDQALSYYQKALESELADDPTWRARLARGLGRVAAQLGLVDVALAALQEASQADCLDAGIQRSLAEAYLAAHLYQESHQATLKALELGMNDPDNLGWVAAHLVKLARQPGALPNDGNATAISALQRATQLDADRYDLWVMLGDALHAAGDAPAALAAYKVLADQSEIGAEPAIQDLYHAAHRLLDYSEPAAAAVCLERALQGGDRLNETDSPEILQLLILLAQANHAAGNLEKAIQTLDQMITIAPSEPHYYLDKAVISTDLGSNPAEIGELVQNSLDLSPDNALIVQRAALVMRKIGDLPEALGLMDQAIRTSAGDARQNAIMRASAADIALAMIQPEIAHHFLDAELVFSASEEIIPSVLPGVAGSILAAVWPEYRIDPLDFFITRAELELSQGNLDGAIHGIVQVMEAAPTHPRLMAIQARLALRRKEPFNAQALLKSAIESTGTPSNATVTDLVSLAVAAGELQLWQTAEELWQKLANLTAYEPRHHLEIARLLTQQAEFQQLCQAIDIVRRAPGEKAFSEESRQAFDNAIEQADGLISGWQFPQIHRAAETNPFHELSPVATARVRAHIQHWRVRGQAIFQPSIEAAKALAALPRNPQDSAARIACLRQIGELAAASLAARDYPQEPMALIQLTLALMEDKPRQALAAVQLALDSLSRPERPEQNQAACSQSTIIPIVHFLTARLLHRSGNRLEDRQAALQAVRSALNAWHDEPRWRILAAEIHIAMASGGSDEDLNAAVIHLRQSIEMEPANPAPHLMLGQLYYRQSNSALALQSFEEAARLDPESATPFLWLARTYRMMGDNQQAAAYANRAVAYNPDQPEPLLLAGEIALDARQYREAENSARSILQLFPDHPAALVLQARSLAAMNRPDEALVLLEKALAKTNDQIALKLERVRLLARARGNDAALQAANQLSDEFPDDHQALTLLAEIQEASGKLEEAVRTAQRALRIQSGGLAVANHDLATTHHIIGRLMRRAGQLDQALYHLSEAVRIAPELFEATLELGQVHQERREHSQALSVYRQALSSAPNDPRPYILIGQALKESKDYVGAEVMLRRASELSPNDLAIHRQLAAVVALNLVHNRRETMSPARLPH